MRLLTTFVILVAGVAPAAAQSRPAPAQAARAQAATQATATAAAQAQSARATAAPAAAATAKGATSAAAATPAVPVPAADLEPQGFTYEADGRRDPFVSLLRRGSDTERAALGARPQGIAGLGASEVTLKGTLASRGGYVAILQGADSKTYIVHPGERLMDGTVRTITQDAMVILQQVKDPLSLEKQREVRKALRQNEEAK